MFCIFCKFHWKAPELESLFNKVAGLEACNFIKKRIQQRCFPVKFAKLFKTPFFTEHLQWLLLYKPFIVVLLQAQTKFCSVLYFQMQELQLMSLRIFIHCLLLLDVSDKKILAHFEAVPLSNKTCSR